MLRKQLNLEILAENGMRRGLTTGTCAAAAAKAASLASLGCRVEQVQIAMPNNECYATVPIRKLSAQSDRAWRAEVIKDAGDDPDVTHGATIFAVCEPNGEADHRLFAAEGVGTVTRAGLRVPVGQPAINPVPRAMILNAVQESFEETETTPCGIDVYIGCMNGAELAKKTFNPRLGVEGGISILGTTGIVEPMSLAAWQASVEVYIRVAMAAADTIALLPGNIGMSFGRSLGMQQQQLVMISNFLGFALDTVGSIADENGRALKQLWVLGHPGKLAKALDGHWDTHSQNSPMAMSAIGKFARDRDIECWQRIEQANTVEAAIQIVTNELTGAEQFWTDLEEELRLRFLSRTRNVSDLRVRLFDMSGRALTKGGSHA